MTKAKTKPATQAQKDAALANLQALLNKSGLPRTSTAGAWKDVSAPLCNSTTSGDYDGRELRPFTGRPGSLDALACPSLQGGRLVYRSAS